MNESRAILTAFKRTARAQGLTYKDIGQALKLSEASIKRMFSQGNLSLDRLSQLCALVQLSVAELAAEAHTPPATVRRLSNAQEKELVSDPKLLLIAVCALNHWTLADMLATYALSEAACVQRLLRLDKLGLIALLPSNRIRLRVSRDFDWLPKGPIATFFRTQGQAEFLSAPFDGPQECSIFFHGMLSVTALAQFRQKLDRLRADFAELHAESLSAPFAHRTGIGVFMAMRAWEPQSFFQLRRNRASQPLTGTRKSPQKKRGSHA
ncbi:MAG TPA: transcriptional regulator [Burkholderiales bacterium]|nr:transcriptional regulator [Burkholderiales bacterium]